MVFFLLFESAVGYALFERLESEEIGDQTDSMQESFKDFKRFSKLVKLTAFQPFASAEEALENCNDISEGILNPKLKHFLELNFPISQKEKGAGKHILGVGEEKLASAIQEELSIPCTKTPVVFELLRGIRQHFETFLKSLKEGAIKEGDLKKAQRGLGHSYSRAKVKFNVNKADNNIIQAISLLDQLDKDINTFAMRVREWYSWHFPELIKIVNDNIQYARLVKVIKNRTSINDETTAQIEEILGDPEKAKQVVLAAKASMGQDISAYDMDAILSFAERVVNLAKYRVELSRYLTKKMRDVAPNLSELVGEIVGARLIAHAGSLTNLAKYPASTVQILGAEKALFRALKTRGNTPKYGLIFNSSFIGRAKAKDKGRISRFLANKCALAARIDSFSELNTTKFGEKLKEQVEERLKFFETGIAPKKNIDVMREVLNELHSESVSPAERQPDATDATPPSAASLQKTKKRKKPDTVDTENEQHQEDSKKKRKKHKKRHKAAEQIASQNNN
jgi:nucleolar protein 56